MIRHRIHIKYKACERNARALWPASIPTQATISMSQEAASLSSALTSSIIVENEKAASQGKEDPLSGHGESALPEDKVQEALENEADDWENDPENARNWSWGSKWTAVSIVRHTLLSSACLSRDYSGIILHLCSSTSQFNDGAWT